MLQRLLISLLISAVGSMIFYFAHQEWIADPVRHYKPGQAVVKGHTLTLDRNRWDASDPATLCLSTKMSPITTPLREVTVREYFETGGPAWNWILTHPPGSTANCLFSEDGSEGAWDNHSISGPMLAMIVGALLILCGPCVFAARDGDGMRNFIIVPLVCGVFFLAGCLMAWNFWPAAVQQVKAAQWEPVPYTFHGQRSIRAGRSSTTQQCIRYRFRGQDYVDVVSPSDLFQSASSKSQLCRVNPEKPWQVKLSWGWHPGLGLTLFPVPFLAVGVFAFLVFVSPDYRRFLRAGRSERMTFAYDSKSELLGTAFAFVFVGSIVGVFVSVCAAMWWNNLPMKWALTLFLIPFVVWVLKLAMVLFQKIRSHAPGKAREPERGHLHSEARGRGSSRHRAARDIRAKSGE